MWRMPFRPKKNPKPKRSHVPGCVVLKDSEAESFLRDQLLLHTMLDKHSRNMENAETGDAAVTISIGAPVRYAGVTYLAHIYRIDNFEDPALNGWIIHLWHPNLVMHKHPTYRSYMTQMGDDLSEDLWAIGV
jgi:hypothetical protein